MSRIEGPDRVDVFGRSERFVDLVESAVWHTLDAVARRLDGVVTVDSVGGIYTEWQRYVPALRDHVGQAFMDSAAQTRAAQRTAVVAVLRERDSPLALTAAVTVRDQPFEVPLVANVAAEQLMLNAENRLANVGNDIWESARAELVLGLRNGEPLTTLRDRVVSATDFSAGRAEVVARTEVAHAMNAGSLAQMKMLNAPGMTREWIATHDGRTRPAHAHLDGKKVLMNESFPGGIEPGSQPNCRCTYGFDVPDDALEGVCG